MKTVLLLLAGAVTGGVFVILWIMWLFRDVMK